MSRGEEAKNGPGFSAGAALGRRATENTETKRNSAWPCALGGSVAAASRYNTPIATSARISAPTASRYAPKATKLLRDT